MGDHVLDAGAVEQLLVGLEDLLVRQHLVHKLLEALVSRTIFGFSLTVLE